jgi:hypothetical protein
MLDKLKRVGSAVNTKVGSGLVGGLVGASAFGITLFAAPSIIHAAVAPVATAFAAVLGATAGTYIAAMVAVGIAAALITAMLAIAIQMLVNAAISKFAPKAPAGADLEQKGALQGEHPIEEDTQTHTLKS